MNELSKARVTVSMDRGVWADGKVKAHKRGVSFSSYLEMLIRGSEVTSVPADILDRIESKIDLLIPKGMPKSLAKGRASGPEESLDESIKFQPDSVAVLPSQSEIRSYSKDKQLGRGGKK